MILPSNFYKFYQGDVPHFQEGNGLGFALIKKTLDILGAEIYVLSKTGKGSTFTALLEM
jgi:signal transduction histidine kinase